MGKAMTDTHQLQLAPANYPRGWSTFALMLCAAVSVVVLGAIPLLRLFPTP
jgi:hypothetical protein